MFGWWKELLEIRYSFKERQARLAEDIINKENMCQSCEVLKVALERANYEKEQVLNRLLSMTLNQSTPVVAEQISTEPKHPIALGGKRQLPFAIKREMLESEDRQKAALLKKHSEAVAKAKLDTLDATKLSIRDLENELGISGEQDAVSSR